MSRQTRMAIFAIMLSPLFIGCSANQAIIRGQNQPGVVPVSDHYCQPGEPCGHSQAAGQYIYPAQECSCKGKGCQKCRVIYVPRSDLGRKYHGPKCKGLCHHYPAHHHSSTYITPNWNKLQYPSNNLPAGLVQYPYYTHKGPDDFFLKENF